MAFIDLLGEIPHLEATEPLPSASNARPNGLLAYGGSLDSNYLLSALRSGIYPLSMPDKPTSWWSPCPRGVFFIKDVKISSRRRRKLAALEFETTINKHFSQVVSSCAECGERRLKQWMSNKLQKSYVDLAEAELALSYECHHEGFLVGGIFGVHVTNKVFSAVSMFHRANEAGTYCLLGLVDHLSSLDVEIMDIQKLTAHTARFGACEIGRKQYLEKLA